MMAATAFVQHCPLLLRELCDIALSLVWPPLTRLPSPGSCYTLATLSPLLRGEGLFTSPARGRERSALGECPRRVRVVGWDNLPYFANNERRAGYGGQG